MAKISKVLASENQVETTLDLGDKNKDKMKNLQNFDLNFFVGKSYFDDDGLQSYSIFQPIFKSLKIFTDSID